MQACPGWLTSVIQGTDALGTIQGSKGPAAEVTTVVMELETERKSSTTSSRGNKSIIV